MLRKSYHPKFCLGDRVRCNKHSLGDDGKLFPKCTILRRQMSSDKVELQSLFRVSQFLLNNSHDVPCLKDVGMGHNDLLEVVHCLVVVSVYVCIVG